MKATPDPEGHSVGSARQFGGHATNGSAPCEETERGVTEPTGSTRVPGPLAKACGKTHGICCPSPWSPHGRPRARGAPTGRGLLDTQAGRLGDASEQGQRCRHDTEGRKQAADHDHVVADPRRCKTRLRPQAACRAAKRDDGPVSTILPA